MATAAGPDGPPSGPSRHRSSTRPSLSSAPSTPQPPTLSRSQTHAFLAPPSWNGHYAASLPSTPFLTPQGSTPSVYIPASSTPKRLLMPTVRNPRTPANASPRIPPPTKFSPSKSRSRAGSTSNPVSPELQERPPNLTSPDWIGGGRKFEVVEEQLELEGYQIFAVERWVVERRPVITLTVFTGDLNHKITATALSPQSSLSQTEAQAEWDAAIKQLRREGARLKEIDKGTLMVTSLANFRSDYTIVHIPRGNFFEVREQLYTNINLLRMGCSGRSALTLEEPSDATKDRFISMYRIPEKALARDPTLFNETVLELVKLIQASLVIYGMLDLAPEDRNGLLCDGTFEGLRRWVIEIGEVAMKVEPMERVADPSVVAALFSSIATIRTKLNVLGYAAPKDPFLDLPGFVRALNAYASKPNSHSHSHSLSISQANLASPTALTGFPGSSTASPVSCAPQAITYLTLPLIESISTSYDKKARQNESYKVHRVLMSKLDDLTTDLRTGNAAQDTGAASTVNPTSDLGAFVGVIIGSAKEAPQCLRYLWTGRPSEVRKRRRDKEMVWSDGEINEDREKEKEVEKEADGRTREGREGKLRDKYERDREKEGRLSEDDGEHLGKPWSGRMQRRIENWAVLGRGKKLSVDFGTLGKAFSTADSPPRNAVRSPAVPSVTVSIDGEEDEVLSSGQVSPVTESAMHNPSLLSFGSLTPAARSFAELSDYDRRLTEFNQKRPRTRPTSQSRIISWSDPVSARGFIDEDGVRERRRPGASRLGKPDSPAESEEPSMTDISSIEGLPRRRPSGYRRRRSADDARDLRDMRLLPIEHMRVDVELCGQLLIMHRREAHLANIAGCLAALTQSLEQTNAQLRHDHDSVRPAMDDLARRAQALQHLEASRTRADALTQETQALAYESAQFSVDELWHMAAQPRQRVFALRQKAFGTGRRYPQGVRGAHGRFTYVQGTLDGQEKLVDRVGRTESEAEDEDGLPVSGIDLEPEVEEVDAVQNQTLRPTWLLQLFNYWGSKWGPSTSAKPKQHRAVKGSTSEGEDPPSAVTTSTPSSPNAEAVRSRGAVRVNTAHL